MRASTIEGQIARVADIVAYVNHDIDDAQRAGIISETCCRRTRWRSRGQTSSQRIGRLVTNVVEETLAGGVVRNADEPGRARRDAGAPRASCSRRSTRTRWPRPSSPRPTASSAGCGRRCGLGPAEFLDLRTVEQEGLDRAAQDFLAGMTDRYAVNLFEQLYIPKPWVTVTDGPRMV